MTSEKHIATAEECRAKNFFYFFIIDTREMNRQSGIILKGYVNHHCEVCPFDSCPIRAFKRLMNSEKLSAHILERRKFATSDAKNLHSDNNSLLQAQARALYFNAMDKFSRNVQLRIDYANFLLARMRDRKGCLQELTKAEKEKTSLSEQFQIYRMRKIVEDELTESHESGGIDIIAAMNFDQQFKAFKQSIERSSNLHFEFWSHLQDDSPDLMRLQIQGAKINQSILSVEENWKKLSSLTTNAPKAIKMYATFLMEILNDKEAGNEQMMKAKEAANVRTNFDGNNHGQETDVNGYAQDGTPCVYISGEADRLGIVNQCNMSLCKIFGYNKKEDILNKNIKILQPNIYADHHDKFLKESIQKAPDALSSRERQIFGKHFSGYIIPLWLQIKNLPSLLAGRQFVATFKVEKNGINKQVCYMLFDTNFDLAEITASCLPMLGITQETIHKRQVYYDIPTLFPNLLNNNSPNIHLLSKQGSPLVYNYPKLIEYTEKSVSIMSSDAARRRSIMNGLPQNEEDRPTQDGDEEGGRINGGVNGDEVDIEDDTSLPRQYTYSRMKSQASIKPGSKKNSTAVKVAESEDDDAKDESKYQYRAVGSANRTIAFQANVQEINFDLIQRRGGFYMRLEAQALSKDQNNFSGVPKDLANFRKRPLQEPFQFSYDPIFKRFTRELRDTTNRNFLTDRFYLDLKLKKEQSKQEGAASDPIIQRYQAMSYINFLSRQQRMIERNLDFDDFEDDDEQESEDSSDSESEEKSVQKKKSLRENSLKQMPMKSLGQLQTQAIDQRMAFVAGDGYGKEFLKGEIDRLINLLLSKQLAGQGVHTYARSESSRKGWEEIFNQKAGLFSDRGEGMEKEEEEEEDESALINKKSEKPGDGEGIKANIKSKKAFALAINDKTMPPAISRLSTAAQVLVLCLVSIAIIEYAVIFAHFSDLKNNFLLIEKSYLRTGEIQKVAYNARTMINMASGYLTNYAGFLTAEEYGNYIKNEFSNSLDLIYKVQNEINLSQLPVSKEHDTLLNSKNVTLYFKESSSTMRALQFSLTESILQISSTIFTISKMQMRDFSEVNEDVFFLMYNSFNEFYQGLKKSSEFYIKEMSERTDQREEISLILFILSTIILGLCFIFLIPVVASVNFQKDRVLSLFCEIDNGILKALSGRCEKFINQMQLEESSEDLESHDELEGDVAVEEEAEEYNLLSGGIQRSKKPKNNSKTEQGFYFKFFIALLFIFAYYLQNLLLNTDAVNAANVLGNELNATAIAEPFYWFALNTQREMIFNKDRVILNRPSLQVATQTLYQLYDQQNMLQQDHLKNQGSLDQAYLDLFDSVMRNDLCTEITYFKNTTLNCSAFISGNLQEGLHVVSMRYFETLKEMLNVYQTNLASLNGTAIRQMNNLNSFYELYVIQNHVTQKLMRKIMTTLSTSIQTEFQYRSERKMAIFIVFLIVILLAFVIFWLPFLSGLNLQIYKTKLMLLIIPLEILLKIKNVGKVLQSQSFMHHQQKSSSRKGGKSGKKDT